MFQFRRFPSYAYFVQRRMTAYCAAGLPHSEIPGSMDICSSPRLFAACHVLLRLLMPRHSPCALSSLTCSSQNPLSSLAPRFQSKPASLGFGLVRGREFRLLLRVVREFLVLFENYAGFSKMLSKLYYPASFRMLFHNLQVLYVFTHNCLSVALLHTSSHCSVFKVQGSDCFAVRFEDPTPVGSSNPKANRLVGLSGLEPPTLRLSVVRSSQLSYRPVWWR